MGLRDGRALRPKNRTEAESRDGNYRRQAVEDDAMGGTVTSIYRGAAMPASLRCHRSRSLYLGPVKPRSCHAYWSVGSIQRENSQVLVLFEEDCATHTTTLPRDHGMVPVECWPSRSRRLVAESCPRRPRAVRQRPSGGEKYSTTSSGRRSSVRRVSRLAQPGSDRDVPEAAYPSGHRPAACLPTSRH
jgi:hypothetical protein